MFYTDSHPINKSHSEDGKYFPGHNRIQSSWKEVQRVIHINLEIVFSICNGYLYKERCCIDKNHLSSSSADKRFSCGLSVV